MQQYIDSGALEIYVMGAATEDEVQELMVMKARYPEVNEALKQLEIDMELVAGQLAITPPPSAWNKIEQNINDIILREETQPAQFKRTHEEQHYKREAPGDTYIQVEGESTHMRLHKSWRWVFAAVFVLGKIFLIAAIYYYLENRQAQEQVQQLKTELKQYNP